MRKSAFCMLESAWRLLHALNEEDHSLSLETDLAAMDLRDKVVSFEEAAERISTSICWPTLTEEENPKKQPVSG